MSVESSATGVGGRLLPRRIARDFECAASTVLRMLKREEAVA